MPTKPKAKKKRGIVVLVARIGDGDMTWCRRGNSTPAYVCYKTLIGAGLPELKPGESVKVRVVIEEV